MDSEQYNLATLLDKIRSHYPYGIPREAIVAPVPVQAELPPPARCLFVIILDTATLSPAHSDLLDAICTKGLQIPRQECHTAVLSRAASQEEISTAIEQSRAPLTVVLGSQAPHGTVAPSKTGVVLFSHPLPTIANDIAAKRDFWGLLQGHRG
jgi:hypothetical protein